MRFISFTALFLALTVPPASGAETTETPHLVFVTEFIRELAALEDVRAYAEREFKQSTIGMEQMMSAVHASTAIQLELGSQITMLTSMHISDPQFDDLIPNIAYFYGQKVALHP